jgi:hypothetical protein
MTAYKPSLAMRSSALGERAIQVTRNALDDGDRAVAMQVLRLLRSSPPAIGSDDPRAILGAQRTAALDAALASSLWGSGLGED